MLSIEPAKYGDNKCFICGETFHHTRTWIKKDDEPLPVMNLRVCHRSCEKLVEEIEAKKIELMELEYKLFLKKNIIDNEMKIVL